MARKWTVALVGLLAVTNGIWFYKLVDRAVTFDYQGVAIEGHRRDKLLLAEITVQLVADCRVAAAEQRLSAFNKSHLVQRKGDVVFVDNVGLRFQDDKLVNVVFSDEPASRPPPVE